MCRAKSFWLIPILFVGVLTPFTPWLDKTISGFFYNPDALGVDRFVANRFVDFMFDYGIYPAWIVFILSTLGLIASFVSVRFQRWQSPVLAFLLTFIIGAGFFTHLVLKDHWGRPRPKQTIEFGGSQEFRAFYSPNFFHQPEPSKSFPCGHCSMGFVFFTVALVGMRLNNKWLTYVGWTAAVLLGSLLGITRIMQGGHFFSDVVMSALILWLTALGIDWLIYQDYCANDSEESPL